MTYSAEVLADTPLVYLRLGESSGTTASDSSGNALDGTYIGSPTLGVTGALSGSSNTAATFNGSTQAVTVPATGLPSTDQDQTLECWVKYTTTTNSLVIVGRDNSSGSRGMALLTFTGGKLQLGNTGSGFARTALAYNDGNYHHVVGIRHATAGTFELYVDGTSVATATFANLSAATILSVAERGDGTLKFPGTIDEVAYYGTALSSTRITAHHTAGTTIPGTTGSPANLALAAPAGSVKSGVAVTAAAAALVLGAAAGAVGTPTTAPPAGFTLAAPAGIAVAPGATTAGPAGFTLAAPAGSVLTGQPVTAGPAAISLTAPAGSASSGAASVTASPAAMSLTAPAGSVVAAPLASAGDQVDVWDNVNAEPFTEYRALIDLPSDLDNSDDLNARIRAPMVPFLAEGIRNPGERETVSMVREGDEWVVIDMPDRTPHSRGNFFKAIVADGLFGVSDHSGFTGASYRAPFDTDVGATSPPNVAADQDVFLIDTSDATVLLLQDGYYTLAAYALVIDTDDGDRYGISVGYGGITPVSGVGFGIADIVSGTGQCVLNCAAEPAYMAAGTPISVVIAPRKVTGLTPTLSSVSLHIVKYAG